jgi:hypothetical protein
MPALTQTFLLPFLVHFKSFEPDTEVEFTFEQEPPALAADAAVAPPNTKATAIKTAPPAFSLFLFRSTFPPLSQHRTTCR